MIKMITGTWPYNLCLFSINLKADVELLTVAVSLKSLTTAFITNSMKSSKNEISNIHQPLPSIAICRVA